MARHRPRRGEPGPDVLAEGDVGEYHPQGGAREGADVYMESGNLQAREFGVPQADLPGGKGHTVNAPTRPEKPAVPPERPADYHKYHGVPSDDGQYEVPDGEVGRTPKPAPVPKVPDAVPVYLVEGAEGRVIRTASPRHIIVPASTAAEPVRVCGKDPRRVEVLLLNEDTATDIRVSETRNGLISGPGNVLGGALIPWPANSYTAIATQDELYAIGAKGAGTPLLSIIEVFEAKAG
jgi:hypothetical protein